MNPAPEALRNLLSAAAVRERAHELLDLALAGKVELLKDYLSPSAPWTPFRELTFPQYLDTFAATSVNAGMLIGHNTQIAWGFTTTHSDTQDLFIERLVGTDRYASPDGPLPFTTRTERIAVKGEETVEIAVRETRHGPVISDAGGEAAAIAAAEGHAVTLAWPLPVPQTPDCLMSLSELALA